MKSENKILLDQCRPFYDMLIRTDTMQGMSSHQLSELQRVNSEEFHPGYRANLSCPPCVADFVKLVYRSYDVWIAAQPPTEPIIVHASFPANDPPKFAGEEDAGKMQMVLDIPKEIVAVITNGLTKKDNPEVYESVISKRAEKRKQESLKRHGK